MCDCNPDGSSIDEKELCMDHLRTELEQVKAKLEQYEVAETWNVTECVWKDKCVEIKQLRGLLTEAVASLRQTGCDVSLVADIDKALTAGKGEK